MKLSLDVRASLRIALYNALSFWAGFLMLLSVQRSRLACAIVLIAMVPWTTFWACFTTSVLSFSSSVAPTTPGNVIDFRTGKRR